MTYYLMLLFSDFQFDAEQKVLYKNGETVALNANQAKLLCLLLAHPEKVFSKYEILDQVWGGRPVSEQVVFQNISQLRAIFSDSAIKTFPKRGYQWQLSIKQKANTVNSKLDIPTTTMKRQDNGLNIKKWQFAVLLMLLVTAISYMLYQNLISAPSIATQQQQNPLTADIAMLPFSTRIQGELDTVKAALNDKLMLNNQIDQLSNKDIDTNAWEFFNSPYMVRKQLISNSAHLVLSGVIYSRTFQETETSQPQYLLEYLIQGEHRNWQGYLLASDVNQLSSQLTDQVENITHSKYFNLVSDSFTTAELSLLHGKYPDNLDTLKHLIERLLIEDSYDEASARIEQMLSQSIAQQHPIYTAYAHWLKGRLLLELKQYGLAQSTLHQADKLIAEANFLALQSEINKSLARIAFANKNFEQIKHYLYQAASQARLANRPVQEVRAYTLLSINASVLGLHQEKYDYLYKAKTLLDDYKLDGSHYMLIYYHFALFAESEQEKEEYYLKILEQPATPKNYWVFIKVSNKLANMYIKRKQWHKAMELADNVIEPARNAYIKAQILRAQDQIETAREQAKRSFNSARTQRIDWIGLDMALMLLELTDEQSSHADILLYSRYIKKNANSWWAKENKVRLHSVGISLDPYNDV